MVTPKLPIPRIRFVGIPSPPRAMRAGRSLAGPLSLLLACCLGLVPAPVIAAGDAALDFPFRDLRGTERSLAEFRGKVVVLEFWASWCVPCRKGFPFLDGLQKKHGPAGLQVVAVSMEEDGAAVKSFVDAHPSGFLVGRDPSGKGAELYQVAAMPTSFLLDRDGREIARFEGGTEQVHEQMVSAIEAVMSGKPLPVSKPAKRRRAPAGKLQAWERGFLADPIMSLDGDTLTRSMREHIHSSKEAAAGDGGVSGGGCGCN